MATSSTPDWPEKALPKEAVEWLFDRMLLRWGKSFVDKWNMLDPDAMKAEWGRALYKVSREEFKRGVGKLNDFERPPNLPEFVKACRPDINPLNAYYEALEGLRKRERGEMGSWSHPAIFWASVRVTAYEMLNQTYSQIRPRWESALEAELEKGTWPEIEAPQLSLPAPNRRPSKEDAAKMMQQLREKAGAPPPAQRDPKDWARKILQRHTAGDKTLLPIQIQFARQALRVEEENG